MNMDIINPNIEWHKYKSCRVSQEKMHKFQKIQDDSQKRIILRIIEDVSQIVLSLEILGYTTLAIDLTI